MYAGGFCTYPRNRATIEFGKHYLNLKTFRVVPANLYVPNFCSVDGAPRARARGGVRLLGARGGGSGHQRGGRRQPPRAPPGALPGQRLAGQGRQGTPATPCVCN